MCDHLSISLSLSVSIDHQVFTGNQEADETKRNTFFPPVVGRFIRLHPIQWYNKATVRMEFYGCELDGKMLLCVHEKFQILYISAFLYVDLHLLKYFSKM